MKRLLVALLCAGLSLASVPALATGILSLSGSQQFDTTSSPPAFLVNGKLFVYLPTTTTCAPVYSDFALTSLLPCPIILNGAGRVPPVYGKDGSVRVRILNSANVLQTDVDNLALTTAAATSGGTTPIPDSTQIFGTRDLKVRFDDQPVSGYVRLNGRTIGSASSGASERANSDTQSLFLSLWGYANVSVVSGKGASAAADWAANKQLTLPDMSGRLLGAMDDLGNGPAGRITSASLSGSTVVGAAGGAEARTIAQAQLPAVTWPDTLGVNITDTTNYTVNNGSGLESHTGASDFGGGAVGSAAATITLTKTGSVTAAKTGSVTSGGSGTALTVLPPVMLLCFYIKL